MKIQGYERKELPSGEGDQVLALSGEWSKAIPIPKQERSYGTMKIAGVMSDMGDRFKQAEDVAEYNRAMVDAHKGQAEIQNDLRGAKNEDGSLKYGAASLEEHETVYKERSKALKDGIAEKIKSATVREKFSTSYDDLDVRGVVQTRDLGRNRLINRERAATETQLNEFANLMVQTGDLQKWADMQGLVQSKVAAGFFTPEEGAQLQDKWRDKAIGAYWERAIQDGPTLAYKMMSAEKPPESFARLDEDKKTQLIAKAKAAKESGEHQARLQTTFAGLDKQFGNNPQKKIAFLENSDNLPELRLDERNQLISTYHAQISRAREAVNQARMDGNRTVTDLFARAYVAQDYEAAAKVLDDPRFTAEQRMHFSAALKAGKTVDVTNPTVRSEFATAFHQRTLPGLQGEQYSDARFIELVDSRRLNGLSNADADKLIGAIKNKQAQYKEGIAYAKDQYALAFPRTGSKSDLEMAARKSDFIDFVTSEWERQGKEKGRVLTPDEQNDVVHSWLDKKVLKERTFWFNDTGREWEAKVKGTGPYTQAGPIPKGRSVGAADQAAAAPPAAAEVKGVPPEAAEKIRLYIRQLNASRPNQAPFKETPENILKFYSNPQNRHIWQPPQTTR